MALCKADKCRAANLKHGHTNAKGWRSPTYRSWQAMRNRCCNPNDIRWHRYGGRGISVCDRWLNSFENFLSDMGEKPDGMTLDRVDNDGNYEPDNCRWATSKTQGRSNYKARMITAFGKSKLLVDWANETGIKRETISRRLNSGWDAERALAERPKFINRWHGKEAAE